MCGVGVCVRACMSLCFVCELLRDVVRLVLFAYVRVCVCLFVCVCSKSGRRLFAMYCVALHGLACLRVGGVCLCLCGCVWFVMYDCVWCL